MANSFRQIVEAPSQFIQELSNLVPWLSKLWRTLGQVEEWHEVGTSGEPAFENSWVNYAAGFETAAFYKDPWGIVHIKGFIKNGTIGTTIFTLPIGYRPSLILRLSTISNNAFARLDVLSTGVVDCPIGNNTWVSINCSFRVD